MLSPGYSAVGDESAELEDGLSGRGLALEDLGCLGGDPGLGGGRYRRPGVATNRTWLMTRWGQWGARLEGGVGDELALGRDGCLQPSSPSKVSPSSLS